MSYNKSQLRKDYKKVFNSSQRKDSKVINSEKSSLSPNNRLVWIPGKSNASKHNNTYSNNKEMDSSSTTSTQLSNTMNSLNHNVLQTKKTYTVINITFNGSSQENVLADTRQVIVLDQPQKKITKKKTDYYLKKSKDDTDNCSLALKNEENDISVTDQLTKSLEDCSLTNRIENVIKMEKEDEFDIVFLNNQQELEIKTINI